MTSDAVRRVPDDEIDGVERWVRVTDEPQIRGVAATRADDAEWPWAVGVWVMEFAREEALESVLRDAIASALRAVSGVVKVAEEDREVWVIRGTPSGEALVRSAAAALDELADRARSYLDQLT